MSITVLFHVENWHGFPRREFRGLLWSTSLSTSYWTERRSSVPWQPRLQHLCFCYLCLTLNVTLLYLHFILFLMVHSTIFSRNSHCKYLKYLNKYIHV